MEFDGYNLREQALHDVFAEIEKALSVRLEHDGITFGTQGATVGFPTGSNKWVRLSWRPIRGGHWESWTGPEAAAAISGVRMPNLYRSYRWTDENRAVVWRADEGDLVASKAVHATGVIDGDPGLSPTWWKDLAESLRALQAVNTERTAVTQEHISRRINQVFAGEELSTHVDEWQTAHADLHLGNLTAPDCVLLDWESWGQAPRGLDVATLWGHSLLVPEVASRVQAEFAEDMNSRSGLLAQLMFCANVIRLNKAKANPSLLLAPARIEAGRLVEALRV
ncbi:hypothetical protein [Actinosynnema mirum]|uniref:Aminoglycoside phosphotransferase n=1 Tax=Actinosynnema mirum (strain ATCC 29888 / DSM 43827 / JCM 3225 / NBRC 14064 / NCIMB 13271 / NRRL B-12336 / IMRU 3971 / 101) TaxID=446462 RepID=C6W8T0_ACTMD|nr:hypothetical protein [Actinosynnema mirum]ACU37179.1 aminoglycoside phosphotransferase [Actinosynnema mirum DSM 43827]